MNNNKWIPSQTYNFFICAILSYSVLSTVQIRSGQTSESLCLM